MTVGELLSKCSSQELTEWGIYYKMRAAEANSQRTNFPSDE